MNLSTREAVLVGKIDIAEAGDRCKLLLGDLDGDGRMELLMVQANGGIDDRYVPHQVQCLTAYNLDGKLLWQAGQPDPQPGGPGSDYPAQICDIDGDGANEVVCVMDKKLLVLDGRTGAVKREGALPDDEAHDCIIIANLSGGEAARELIVKDRYRRMWALDSDFQVMWTHEGNLGHFPWTYDLNGDGRDEVMAGYDLLDSKGNKLWSCRDLEDHADCVWVGDVLGQGGEKQIVIGGSVTVMYDIRGNELWRYEGSIESQHIALGKFRDDLPGLQVAGIDRIVRGDTGARMTGSGKDGMFLLDSQGREVWKEDRKTDGWLTIIETLRGWDDSGLDRILAYRRGGDVYPTLYDGYMREIASFPVDGYAAHADLTGSGEEQVLIYTNKAVHVFGREGSKAAELKLKPSNPGRALKQEKRLYASTLYPGGQYE
ncbi:hypothetical protein [Paenibacillus sp. HB172176]|uniref:hypothetical protein n=1 Tax=Paenibacillus sp. HB172176 TaxID=2493690 RepID=UPI00143C91C3|nr:hypothetical protein [Paenibacillus sp. HB172176]